MWRRRASRLVSARSAPYTRRRSKPPASPTMRSGRCVCTTPSWSVPSGRLTARAPSSSMDRNSPTRRQLRGFGTPGTPSRFDTGTRIPFAKCFASSDRWRRRTQTCTSTCQQSSSQPMPREPSRRVCRLLAQSSTTWRRSSRRQRKLRLPPPLLRVRASQASSVRDRKVAPSRWMLQTQRRLILATISVTIWMRTSYSRLPCRMLFSAE
mmetsp:Transcript_22773/g.74138  ORF Transcript_22773/g.74138 Transcript_22773/m.74138 type:complete len:209 (+) Transcript_22773:1985-2611(+)